MTTKQTGDAAEERAAAHLRSKGYEILDRNFRAKFGELDIVARDGGCVVFVEVRKRSRADFGGAAESILWSKRRKLIRAAQLYAAQKNLDCEMRFDVVTIQGDVLEHIEDAFQLT